MKKREQQKQNGFFYNEDGIDTVTNQIMDSYISGTISEHEQSGLQPEGHTES